MADARPPVPGSVRPTVLVVGDDEPMDDAICAALDHHGLDVERVATLDAVEATRIAAPDLVLLVGDAARAAGEVVLARLAQNALTQLVPVVLLSDDAALGERLAAFRHGAVAVVPRTASVDEMARKIADIAREMPEREGEQSGELGEATLDELMKLVKQELRSGILSVEAGGGGTTDASTSFRLVLGAGRPVAKAVEAFVAQLRPLVSQAEPLRYELLEHAGARFGLLDSETGGASEGEGDLAALNGLRVLLVVLDPVRADALASELRARGATVAVTDASGRGLERARGLDPEVVIIDAAGIEGPGFAVVKACRRDPRLRWASMLVVEWDEVWPERARSPDMARLASRLAPLIEPDRTIAARAGAEASFDTRLELVGPSRLLRALARVEHTLHVTVRNPRCVVDLDLAQGLVVGATAKRQADAASAPLLEGPAALAALLALGSGRVRVERRTNPQSANVMSPVEEALAVAAGEEPPLPPSIPPPSLALGLSFGRLGAPDSELPPPVEVPDASPPAFFPGAVPADEDEGSGPLRPQHVRAVVHSLAHAAAEPRDLSWADSVSGAPPAPVAGAAPTPPRPPPSAFDEPPTTTHPRTPLASAKRTLVGVPLSAALAGAQAKPPPAARLPPRLRTMLGVAPVLAPAGAQSGASEPAASPPAAVDPAASEPAARPSPPLELEPHAGEARLPAPARVPGEAAAAAAASPAQTLAPARRLPAPTPQASAALPSLQPLEQLVMHAPPEPQASQPLAPDAFVIPDASMIPSGPRLPLAPARTPRRSPVPLLVVAAVLLGGLAVVVVAGALLLPRLLRSPRPTAGGPTAPLFALPPLPPLRAVLVDAGATAPLAAPAPPPDAGVPAPVAAALPTALPAALPTALPVALPAAHAAPPPIAAPPVPPAAAAPVEDPGPDLNVSAGDRLVVRANRIVSAGDLRQAEVIYLEALAAESRNPHALAGLARLHLARHAGPQALAYAERAVAARPRRSAYRVIQGDALTLLGRRADAQRAYREALSLDPQSREARARLAGTR